MSDWQYIIIDMTFYSRHFKKKASVKESLISAAETWMTEQGQGGLEMVSINSTIKIEDWRQDPDSAVEYYEGQLFLTGVAKRRVTSDPYR